LLDRLKTERQTDREKKELLERPKYKMTQAEKEKTIRTKKPFSKLSLFLVQLMLKRLCHRKLIKTKDHLFLN
jgi:hypothetical protein